MYIYTVHLYQGLRLLRYMINNQLSFYIYTLVDPGTVFLFKAASTMIVAAVQCTFVGKAGRFISRPPSRSHISINRFG